MTEETNAHDWAVQSVFFDDLKKSLIGKDVVIDLTAIKPNSISSSGIFVVKLKQ